MVFQRKQKKGAKEFETPNYDPKDKYITVVLHYGGAFGNSASCEYEGGKKVCFDWCKVDDMSISSLNKFSEIAGVTENRRYHLGLKDGGFKLFVDDEDVKKWCLSFLTLREMHVYIEMLNGDFEDSEDSDYIVKSGCTGDDDDSMFDELVDFDVEDEYDSISTTNIVDEDKGPPANVHVEGEADDDDMDSFDDSDFTSGNDLSEGEVEADDDDDELFDDEVENIQEEFDVIDSGNIILEEQQPNVEGVDDDTDSDSDSGEEDMLDTTELLDERRVSEDDEDAEQYPFFNPQTRFNPNLFLKQCFSTKKDFKKAAESHAIKWRRNIKFTKNDNKRVYARCHSKDCKWMINALIMKNDTTFQIRKILDKHTCAPSNKVKSMTSTWLSERFQQRFKSDGNRSVRGFMVDAMYDTRLEISKTQAYKAKKKALAQIEGDTDAQYSKLWAYADELRKTNPGSTILLGTEVNNGVTRFREFYVCFNALKQGFLKGCRKLIGVDGCFLKGKHGGMLLSAVGVDGNNNPFPVAYAVVERENQEIWEWFLHILKTDLEIKVEEITFMSDKKKGLINAMETIFPGVDHRFCVRHLINNLKVAGFRGNDYTQRLWYAAISTTEGQFNAAMEDLKKYSEGAWKWLQNKPPHQWSKAFFNEKSKCDLLLNNICESFNANILEARDKPIITMLEWIRESLMVRLQKNRDRALAKWKGKLCPKIQKIMQRNMDGVNDCTSLKASDTHYQVTCFSGGQYTVDLKKLTCTCRRWQLTGIPCTHSICAMLRQRMDPMDFVNDCYSVDAYNTTYELPIYGISHDLLWGNSMFIPPIPPNFGQRAKRGRKPSQKRRMQPFEAEEKKGKVKLQKMKRQCNPYKCKRCGESGHNILSCGKEKRKEVEKRQQMEKRKFKQADSSQVEQAGPSQVVDQAIGHMAPPMQRTVEERHIEDEGVSSQQSHITASQTLKEGPSMHQQLQMGRQKK